MSDDEAIPGGVGKNYLINDFFSCHGCQDDITLNEVVTTAKPLKNRRVRTFRYNFVRKNLGCKR